MYKACIFDLDGTLINSLKDLAASTNYALEKQGLPTHEVENFRYFAGNGVGKMMERALPEAMRTPERIAETRAYFDAYYDIHSLDYTKPYEGIPQLLEALKAKGLMRIVVSNKPDAFVKKLVRSFFRDLIDEAVGQIEGIPRKPDPAAVFNACWKLGVSCGSCIYLGDSGVDMLTAKAAGMFAVGVLWGFRSREELLENGADALIEKPSGLLELLSSR